jgi:hypothetical protein
MLLDLQLDTARSLWRTQARTAAMLGLPDYSHLFRAGDDRSRRLFSLGAEQALNTVRHAQDAVLEVQRQIGRLAEQQAILIADEMRDQIEQIGRRSERELQAFHELAVSGADELANAGERAIDEAERQRDENEDDERDSEEPLHQLVDRSGHEAGEREARRGKTRARRSA